MSGGIKEWVKETISKTLLGLRMTWHIKPESMRVLSEHQDAIKKLRHDVGWMTAWLQEHSARWEEEIVACPEPEGYLGTIELVHSLVSIAVCHQGVGVDTYELERAYRAVEGEVRENKKAQEL